MRKKNLSNSITFLVPIKNRPSELNRLLKNCKKVFKKLNYYFLIIDASNQRNRIENLKIISRYKNIKLIKQKSKGIQKGCLEGIKYIKTKYTSFLYDDDVMGDHINKIYKSNILKNQIFSFGYGVVKDINENVTFKNLSAIKIKKDDMISYYFGNNINKEFKNLNFQNKIVLPVSPICTSFKTSFLKKWEKVLNDFVYGNSFRNYFFFKKEVGPDLLTFLLSIDESNKTIKFFYPFSVKFSSHQKSISVIYGNAFLRIGYWLARICYFNQNTNINTKTKNEAYTYLISLGFFILITNLFNRFYFRNTLIEILKLIKNRNFRFSFYFLINLIINKIFK